MTNEHRRLFILGAGFSKACGFPLGDQLAAGLLERFQRQADGDEELGQLVKLVTDTHAWMHGCGVGIEELYTYLFVIAERLRLRQHFCSVDRGAGATPWRVAEDIEKSVVPFLDEDLVCELLEHDNQVSLEPAIRFARCLRPGDAIVTFNYDTIVERACEEVGANWCYPFDDKCDEKIAVAKLHGSVDWIALERDEIPRSKDFQLLFKKPDPPDGSLDPGGRPPEDEYDLALWRVADRNALHETAHSRALIQWAHRWGLAGLGPAKRPSIIPGLGHQWALFEHMLSNAAQIVSCGFSYSTFDMSATFTIAATLAQREADQNAEMPQVTVIDPTLEKSGDMLETRARMAFRDARWVAQPHQKFDWSSL